MSETFLENEQNNESKNSMDLDDIQTIEDTATNLEERDNLDVKTEDEAEPIREEATTEEQEADGWIDLLGSGAIMKKVIQEGTPDTKPQRNEKCTINYTCTLEDGTVADCRNNFEFYLTESEVSFRVCQIKFSNFIIL